MTSSFLQQKNTSKGLLVTVQGNDYSCWRSDEQGQQALSSAELIDEINKKIQNPAMRWGPVVRWGSVVITVSIANFSEPFLWISFGLLIAGLIYAAALDAKESAARRTHLAYELDDSAGYYFNGICEAFQDLSKTKSLVLLMGANSVGDFRHRATSANTVVLRKTKNVPYIHTEFPVWCLDLGEVEFFLFPEKLFVFEKGIYSLASYSDWTFQADRFSYPETSSVPSDCESAGYTWRYTKQDGSADQRYTKKNYKIPIVTVGQLDSSSDTDSALNFILGVSSPSRAEQFVDAMDILSTGEVIRKTHSIPDPVQEKPSDASSKAARKPASLPKQKKQSLDASIEKLENLIGLQQVKTEVNELINFIKVQQMRHEKGLSNAPISRHLVFYGNPGTGKTTVARIIAEVYQSLGVLSKGHLTETDRSGLVAGFLGQTALKVQEVVGKAKGGVLFIDEAYSLVDTKNGDSFAQEAIDTLVKLMEDNRDDLVVIVAGYPDKMTQFINSNPGLQSRFNRYFSFEDYDSEQLLEIFRRFCADSYNLSPDAEQEVSRLCAQMYGSRTDNFGNARDVRNAFESIIASQANRIVKLKKPDAKALKLIEADDVRAVLAHRQK